MNTENASARKLRKEAFREEEHRGFSLLPDRCTTAVAHCLHGAQWVPAPRGPARPSHRPKLINEAYREGSSKGMGSRMANGRNWKSPLIAWTLFMQPRPG